MIRKYSPADAEAVLGLNAANVPEVGELDSDKLTLLHREAIWFAVVELGGNIEGALVLLAEGGSYGSANYRWFSDHYPAFAYVDRVMLSPATRGQGWGVRLYEDAVEVAVFADKPVLTAEVNTEPPNLRSIRFHEQFGFVEVGRERPYGPSEEVAMFALDLQT